MCLWSWSTACSTRSQRFSRISRCCRQGWAKFRMKQQNWTQFRPIASKGKQRGDCLNTRDLLLWESRPTLAGVHLTAPFKPPRPQGRDVFCPAQTHGNGQHGPCHYLHALEILRVDVKRGPSRSDGHVSSGRILRLSHGNPRVPRNRLALA